MLLDNACDVCPQSTELPCVGSWSRASIEGATLQVGRVVGAQLAARQTAAGLMPLPGVNRSSGQ